MRLALSSRSPSHSSRRRSYAFEEAEDLDPFLGGKNASSTRSVVMKPCRCTATSNWRSRSVSTIGGPVHQLLREEGSGRFGRGVPCRKRYADDKVTGAIDAGLEQVVILGAGLDARA